MCYDEYDPTKDPDIEFDPEESNLAVRSVTGVPYGDTTVGYVDWDEDLLPTAQAVKDAGLWELAIPHYYDENGDFIFPDEPERREARRRQLEGEDYAKAA